MATGEASSHQPYDAGCLAVRSDDQATVTDDHKDEDDLVDCADVAFDPTTERADRREKLLTTMEAAVDLCKRHRGDPEYRDTVVGQVEQYMESIRRKWDPGFVVVPSQDFRVIERFVRQCSSYYQHASNQFCKINATLSIFTDKIKCLGYECVLLEVDISDDALSYLLSSLNYVTKQLKSDLFPSKNELLDEIYGLLNKEDGKYALCLLDMFCAVVEHIRIQITISQFEMFTLLRMKRVKLQMTIMAKLDRGPQKSVEDDLTDKEGFLSAFKGFSHVQRALNTLFFPQPIQVRSKGNAGAGISKDEAYIPKAKRGIIKTKVSGAVPSPPISPGSFPLRPLQQRASRAAFQLLVNVEDVTDEQPPEFEDPIDQEVLADDGEAVADPRQEEFEDAIDQLVDESEAGNTDEVEQLLANYLGKLDLAVQRDSSFGRTPLHYAKNKDVAQMLIDSVYPPKREKFIFAKDQNGKTALENAENEGRESVAKYLRKLPPIIKLSVAQVEETSSTVNI